MRRLPSIVVCGLALMMALTIALTPAVRAASLPSGETLVGQAAIEPAYNDMNGNIIFLLTPIHAPLNVKANSNAWAPLYLVVYPAGYTGTLNCMGVPGNCPDHDGAIAGAATAIMPNVYGTDPTVIPGHDHLVAAPASGGDFNIAWHVYVILFTDKSFVSHLTTLAQVDAALGAKQVISVDSGIVFTCTVVPASVYYSGTPI